VAPVPFKPTAPRIVRTSPVQLASDLGLLAVIRKRSFLEIGRERLAGLVQLEADIVGYDSELLLG
jgi:hypothetical protein